MKANVLEVQQRSDLGKGAARQMRRAGRVPAIAYSLGNNPDMFHLDPNELLNILRKQGKNALLELTFSDGKKPLSVMLKELQRHPIKQSVLHADFVHVDVTKSMQLSIPLTFSGRPVGTQFGGIVNILRREINISTVPGNIPRTIDVDITPLDLGHVLHISDVQVPEGVTVIDDSQLAVVSVASPTGAAEAEGDGK